MYTAHDECGDFPVKSVPNQLAIIMGNEDVPEVHRMYTAHDLCDEVIVKSVSNQPATFQINDSNISFISSEDVTIDEGCGGVLNLHALLEAHNRLN